MRGLEVMYLGPQLFCFSSLLFRLALRHSRLFRRRPRRAAFGTGRIDLLVWPVLTRAILRLVYQHAPRPTLAAAVRVPRTEDARLGRLERLGFSRAAQFGFVRGAEERCVCGFGWVIRRSGVRSGNRG